MAATLAQPRSRSVQPWRRPVAGRVRGVDETAEEARARLGMRREHLLRELEDLEAHLALLDRSPEEWEQHRRAQLRHVNARCHAVQVVGRTNQALPELSAPRGRHAVAAALRPRQELCLANLTQDEQIERLRARVQQQEAELRELAQLAAFRRRCGDFRMHLECTEVKKQLRETLKEHEQLQRTVAELSLPQLEPRHSVSSAASTQLEPRHSVSSAASTLSTASMASTTASRQAWSEPAAAPPPAEGRTKPAFQRSKIVRKATPSEASTDAGSASGSAASSPALSRACSPPAQD